MFENRKEKRHTMPTAFEVYFYWKREQIFRLYWNSAWVLPLYFFLFSIQFDETLSSVRSRAQVNVFRFLFNAVLALDCGPFSVHAPPRLYSMQKAIGKLVTSIWSDTLAGVATFTIFWIENDLLSSTHRKMQTYWCLQSFPPHIFKSAPHSLIHFWHPEHKM